MTTQTKANTKRSRDKQDPKPANRATRKARAAKGAAKPAASATGQATKLPTKRARLIDLLCAKDGVDIEVLSETLGWQQHSTRAALTGLRKAGFEIARDAPGTGGKTRYRITARPEPVAVE